MNVRLFSTIAAILLTAGAVWAQEGLRSPALPERTPANPVPRGQAGLRSPVLPDRTAERPIPRERTDQFLVPDDPRPRPPRHRRWFGSSFGGVFYAPPYSLASPEGRPFEETSASGYLHIDSQPGTAQVYVDGYYMGTVDDFRRIIPGRSIEAGAHRVELRAPGYDTTTFEVLIPPNQTVSYRTDLEAATPAPAAAPPGRPKTFYVIPGCYAGDKPPRHVKLPEGCDRSKVRVVPPTVSPDSLR